MINYEVSHQLMNNLKTILKVLHQNKQNLFSSAEICVVLNGLNDCKPITTNDIKKAPKEVKDDKK